jgi:hypothetical protein
MVQSREGDEVVSSGVDGTIQLKQKVLFHE